MIKCPKCSKEGINYKQYRLSDQVMCRECHYYIHVKELNGNDKTGISKSYIPKC